MTDSSYIPDNKEAMLAKDSGPIHEILGRMSDRGKAIMRDDRLTVKQKMERLGKPDIALLAQAARLALEMESGIGDEIAKA